ncbi:MAG: DUF3472 domain-containing protein, partial [Calditrichaeota bacterium]
MKKLIMLFFYSSAIIAMEDIPQSAMKMIYVDSQETVGENGAAINVLDGNPDTFWHTEWYAKSPGYPHEIVFQLDRDYLIENFSYMPRKNSSNGRMKEYQVFVSNDSNNWGNPIIQGRWPDQTAEQIKDFPVPVSGRYVRLKALSEVNGNAWASAAEISLNDKFDPLTDIDGWASSLHLEYKDKSGKAADLLMVDIMVDSTSPSTYYAAINFTGGYSGLQDQGSKRTLHFSLWDYVDGDNQTVPEEAKAKVLWRGYRVSNSSFGGEGTGVKTWKDYAWKTHQPYRLLLKMTPMSVNSFAGSTRDFWVFDFEADEWMHIATLWRANNPTTGRAETNLGDVYTFVEDWAATSEWYRSCYLFNARKKYWNGMWHTYDQAYYTINDQENNPSTPDRHDPNTQAEVRETNKIWLATGGRFIPQNRALSGSTISFASNLDFNPQAPKFAQIAAEPVDDSTMLVTWEYQEALWAAQESYTVQIYEDAEMQKLVFSSGSLYPHDYEKSAKEKDSDRKAQITGLALAKDKIYYLRLEAKTVFGFTCSNSEAVAIKNYSSTGVSQKSSLQPKRMELEASYPNPFNGTAT